MKYLVPLTCVFLLLGSVSLSKADTIPNPLANVSTDLVYVQSISTNKSAGALRASIPVLELPKTVLGNNTTLNFDALAMASNGHQTFTIGGSVNITGLQVGKISLGLTYIPQSDYKWTGYLSLTPIKF